jgi:hypothetical protein
LFEELKYRFFILAGSKWSPHPFLAALGAWALLTTSCVEPLGPGFRFADRQTEIRVPTGAPEQLHIRVVDRFDNVGNLPLRSLEVRLPEGPNFGAQNVRMTADGKVVSPVHSSELDPRMMRAAFDPVWKQQQPREIVTEWDLTPQASTRGTVAASAAAFYIADETALPLWQPPSGIFAQGGPDPGFETLTVSAPADFRVLAPGKPVKGQNSLNGNLTSQSFHIQPNQDFLPFVIAGRYVQQVISTHDGAVSFWTFKPLDAQQARTAAGRLWSSMRAYTDFFGPASKGRTVIHIAEAPGELPAEFGDENNVGGSSFPDGVLLDSRAFAQGVSTEPVLQLGEYELARTWFGWRVRPRPEAQILMGRGVGLFGLVVAAEARGPDQRARMIEALLDRYDAARRIAADKRMLEPPPGYSRAERISTGYKAALFLVALEDLRGHDNLRAAFRSIVEARGNADVGYEELEAAVESSSGPDLAEMFRAWLIRPGIPEDFRVRYGKPSKAN